ncbi:zincin [Linnemannia elongata AG-77]|uniref:Zincin n=1 Tax=Linnemannia elongata AG-77 TaxID=1314771 RepID=A0A197JPS1_9FUNG|nr:zincin [Linnemannia elongata AG-77]
MVEDILNDMNPNVDPCQDFSQFSCGGFMNTQEIPVDQATTDYFNILYNDNKEAIRSIVDPLLGKPPSPTSATTKNDETDASQANLLKLQDLYSACMDEDTLAKASRQPILDQLEAILASFPQKTTTTATSGSDIPVNKEVLTKALAQLLKQGLAGFVDIAVITDLVEPLVHTLNLKESGLGLPSKGYYKDIKVVQIYEDTIAQMFQIVLGDEDVVTRGQPFMDTDVKQEWKDAAKDVVGFETQLAAIGTELVDQYDPIKANNPRTVAQLSNLVPSIDWALLLAEILPRGVTNTRPIVAQSPQYLTQLQVILQTTTLSTLRHYITWVAIKGFGPNLGLPYRRPLQFLKAAIAGTSPDLLPIRWRECVTVVNTNLGDMAGHFFIQKFFKGNSRHAAISIIDSLLQTYAQIFPTLSWLDDPTRVGAIQKINAMQKLVGYTTSGPDVASSISLQSYYSNLTISKSDHFGNQLRYAVWEKTREKSQLDQPVNQKKMRDPPQTVDAFYDGQSNHIIFPAGILQPPFFHVDNPEYLNYGAMGVAAGHEITHGFDNIGRNYDYTGRVKNWWTNETEKAFNEKSQCFVNQYGNFSIKGPDGKNYNVNGQLTLAENIADNGGLKQAYRTWQSRFQSDPSGFTYKNFKLPGLEKYTPDQLFFISFGRLWCSKERPEWLMQLIRGNAHPPWRFRANGAVQNSVEFSLAFKCKAGTPMNPIKKCEVW